MAIQADFTHPKTGAVTEDAYYLVHPPVMRLETRQMMLKVEVYASKTDKDNGKEPIWTYRRPFGAAEFNPLWNSMKNMIEPALINRFFPGGVSVPD